MSVGSSITEIKRNNIKYLFYGEPPAREMYKLPQDMSLLNRETSERIYVMQCSIQVLIHSGKLCYIDSNNAMYNSKLPDVAYKLLL